MPLDLRMTACAAQREQYRHTWHEEQRTVSHLYDLWCTDIASSL